MKLSCREFRTHLERHLTGEPAPENLTPLSWHEHLLGCAPCRELLEAEEALEYLLASLPDPCLPEHLVPRVLGRLREARELSNSGAARLDQLLETADASATSSADTRAPANLAGSVLAGLALDRLLERLPTEPVPSGLASRVLAGLATPRERLANQLREEAALDRLLDRVPQATPPADLTLAVLDGLGEERFGAQPLERRTPQRLLRLPLRISLGASLAAAALLAALALGLWGKALWGTPDSVQPREMAGGPTEASPDSPGPSPLTEPDAIPAPGLEVAVAEGALDGGPTPDLMPGQDEPGQDEPGPNGPGPGDVELPGETLQGPHTEVANSAPDSETDDMPEEALLAALDLLEDENWDLFFENDDVDLLLSAFDVGEELLLEIDALAPTDGEAPTDGAETDRQG
ncbi:MAG: hypothetical protein QF615_11455 [Planctomycetota bacterium]|nr:hypothetical protein [Planctomycetota bacterium]